MLKAIRIRDPFLEMDNAFNNMDNLWMQLFNQPMSTLKKFKDTGISVIDRPHNVISIKDKAGNVIGNKLEVVTTPFKKDEVSVEISDKTLTVKCEKYDSQIDGDSSEISAFENVECEIHHGISSQSYQFSLKLSDKVDVDSISAKNEDGILTINMPFLKEDKKEDVKKITVL